MDRPKDIVLGIVPVDPWIPYAIRRITVESVETSITQRVMKWLSKLKP